MKILMKLGNKTTELPLDELPSDALIKFGQLFGMLETLDFMEIGDSSFELYMENNDKYIVIGKKK